MIFLDSLVDDVIVRPGVAAIIQNDNQEILYELRVDCNFWGLPGGRIDPGESALEACVREVQEETGLNVKYDRLVGVYTGLTYGYPLRKYSDNTVQVLEIIVSCSIISGKLRRSNESRDLKWFPVNQLPDPLFPGNDRFIEDFLNNNITVL